MEKVKENALQEKETIVRDSKREALMILDNAKEVAQKLYKNRITEVEKEIEAIKKRIIGEGEGKAKELKEKADANLEKAVDLLMKKFEVEVGNA